MDCTAMLAFMPCPRFAAAPPPGMPPAISSSFYETEHKCETARLQKVTAIFTQVGAA